MIQKSENIKEKDQLMEHIFTKVLLSYCLNMNIFSVLESRAEIKYKNLQVVYS